MQHLTLRKKIWILNILRLIELVCICIGGTLSITQNIWYIMLSMISFLFFLQHSHIIRIYRAGYVGEKKAGKLLSGLPRGYVKKHNIHITWNNHKSEIDYLIVGPTGVFIIEVKNMRGMIRGSEDGQNWTQNKMGKNGKMFQHAFYNPIKQVQTHAKRLAKKLNQALKYDQKIWVQGMVLFVHNDVKIELHNIRTPVFTEINPLIHYILNREIKYTQKQVKEILSNL